MTESEEETERRAGIDRRQNGFKLSTKLGSIEAVGEGLMIILVIGMIACIGGIFYVAHLVAQLEMSQRMTMCVLAVTDPEDRWAQITQPNSACSLLARSPELIGK